MINSWPEWLLVAFLLGGIAATGSWFALRTLRASRKVHELIHAERRIISSEKRFRSLVENSSDIITVVDRAGRFTYASPACRTVLGYDPDELLGKLGSDYVHPEDSDKITEAMSRLRGHSSAPVRAEYRVRDAFGQWRLVVSVYTKLLDDPAIAGIVVNSRDITVRRHLDESLRIQAAQFQRLFEGAPMGIAILDGELRVQQINSEYTRIFGYSADEVVGKLITELTVPEEFRQQSIAMAARVLSGEALDLEMQRRRKDGTSIWVSLLARPFQVEGGPKQVYAMYHDVTKRRYLDEALRTQGARFQELFESAPIAIVILDANDRVQQINSEFARMFCYTADEVLGKPINDLIVPTELRQEGLELTAAVASGRTLNREAIRCRKDGSKFWVSIVATPFQIEGSPKQVYAMYHDITKRRELEDRLVRSQKLEVVGELAGGMAHQFNNLLTVIRVHSEFLLQDLGLDNALRDDADAIHKATDRANDLTRQLLTLSRTHHVAPRLVDLSAMVSEMKLVLGQALGEDVKLITQVEPGCVVSADPSQIEQVIFNLSFNARDAMPNGGTLLIYTALVQPCPELKHKGYAGSCVVLTVTDTGTGIPLELQKKIFEPFFTTKKSGEGTGLGLSTAFDMAQHAGGHLEFESVPGRGTTMRLFLPQAEVTGGSAETEVSGVTKRQAAPVPRTQTVTGSKAASILLVEDERGVRDLARRILMRSGYRVFDAESGREAMRIADDHESQIDMLVCDVIMPEMSGPELADLIRKRRPDLPILFISGYSGGKLKRAGLGAGMSFLQKPFSEVDLTDAVEHALLLAQAASKKQGT